jgi:hypothetical protein
LNLTYGRFYSRSQRAKKNGAAGMDLAFALYCASHRDHLWAASHADNDRESHETEITD